jgi:hypothetical protein
MSFRRSSVGVCRNWKFSRHKIGETAIRRQAMKRLILSVVCSLAITFIGSYGFAQMGGGMMGGGQGGMMGGGKSQGGGVGGAGGKIFIEDCGGCHPNGENVIVPNLPIRGSRVIANFKTFVAFIRNPRMPDGSRGSMPAFDKSKISEKQARKLYHYIKSSQGAGADGGYGTGGMMGGYGMGRGMMMGGGYGMGGGMMGGYGMGRGMMGYYTYSPECQKFYDDTYKMRKELHDKRFEYFEALRNPKATGESVMKLEKEIEDLQQKIFAQAPLGCRW